jgi:hypothetical protein
MNGIIASRNMEGEENYTISVYGTPARKMVKFTTQKFIIPQRSEKYNSDSVLTKSKGHFQKDSLYTTTFHRSYYQHKTAEHVKYTQHTYKYKLTISH